MAIYTIKLRDLLKYDGFEIGLNDYPIFDESHRATLNQLILDTYADYEIGMETPALFKYYLNLSMRQIMPYYNQLYESEKYTWDPYNSINVTEIEEGNGTSKVSGSSSGTNTQSGTNSQETSGTQETNGTNENKNLFSNTPSGHLEDVEAGNYLTTATFDNGKTGSKTDSSGNTSGTQESSGTTTSENESNAESTNKVTRTRKGNENSDLLETLKKLRESFLNIDMMIVNDKEIAQCFMPLWG